MKASNIYQIESSFKLQDVSEQLTILYMPIIGSKATSLYLLLNCHNNLEKQTISRLCALMDEPINQIENCFTILEKNGLVKTLYNENNQEYKFVLKKPLSFKDFLNNDYFGRAYLSIVGKQQFSITKDRYVSISENNSDYVDVSSKLDTSLLSNWNSEDEDTFLSLKIDQERLQEFDKELFLNKISSLLLPESLRNKSIIDKISEYGCIYNINALDMIPLVGKSTNNVDNTIDLQGLKNRCISFKNESCDSSYDAHPIAFLQAKQNGVKVASSDKKLIEELMIDYHFSNEMINYLIEYCLENKKFTKGYVEKVATSWIRDKIDTVEKAKETIDNNKKQNSKIVYEYQQEEQQDIDYQELRKKLFKEG